MATLTTKLRDTQRSVGPRVPTYLQGVQGLRTVAALLVAIYHIWFHRVSGGVDVFFVVAGYFAMKSLMKLQRESSFTKKIQFVIQYWMRTLRRIVPSAVVVIVGTVLASLLLMPQSAWENAIPHGFAALFQFENWQLISSGSDYLQEGAGVSPFQQFWALSLQAQIYFSLPIVVLVAVLLAPRMQLSSNRAISTALWLVVVSSFTFSVMYVSADQPAAYFNTFARYWEFVAGSILFLLLTKGLKNQVLANTLGWVGLVVLIGLGMVVDVSTLFPGWIALVPVVAAILIMISAASDSAPMLLRRGPLVWFGDSSFAFYLWHWPILVMYRYASGHEPGMRGGIFVLIVSAVLAILTTKLVETPIRNWGRIKNSAIGTLVLILLLCTPALGALYSWKSISNSKQQAALATVDDLLTDGEVSPATTLIPDPSIAGLDYPDVYRNGCNQNQKDDLVIVCESGVPDGKYTIAVVGGSHSAQWIDIVREAAESVDAKVSTITKSACLFGDIKALPFERTESCAQWSEATLEELLRNPPDLVVTAATRQIDDHDEVPDAYLTYFKRLEAVGVEILAIRDNPRFPYDVAKCVELDGPDACEQPRSAFYAEDVDLKFSELSNVTYLDIADVICPDGICEVVQDNVLVYRDAHHFTRTWVLRHGGVVSDAVVQWFSTRQLT